MWRFISTENDSIEAAFRQISKEYDEGDVKTAQIHLFELTDRIISIVESKQSDCSKPVKEIELEGASDVVEKRELLVDSETGEFNFPKEKLEISKDYYL